MLKPVLNTPLQNVSSTRSPVPAQIAAGATVQKKDEAPPNPADRAEVTFSNAPPERPASSTTETRAEAAETAPENSPAATKTEAKGPDIVTSLETHDDAILKQLKPESVVAARHGKMFGPGKILKYDFFPKVVNDKLEVKIEGAPNYREVKGTNVHGVAQPTIPGIRAVLDRAGAKEKTVMWTNMREEPVLYIDGQSVSLRDLKKPFENSDEFQRLSGKQMEKTEKELKAEILAEAEKYPGKHILIQGEDVNGKLTHKWVKLTKDNVKTPKEVYQDLQKEGYKVDYKRVPVTDEKTPDPEDLEALTERVGKADPGTPQIFNCHAGRGRTTTAMVAAQLIQDAQKRSQSGEDKKEPEFQRIPAVREDIKEQGKYERGEYKLILRTIKALDKNAQVSSDSTSEIRSELKSRTDRVLDGTEDMQNLRKEISKYRTKSMEAPEQKDRDSAKQRGLDYLHRYHTLITFDAYVNEQAKDGFKVPYEKWLKGKPELQDMLKDFELAFNKPQPGAAQYA